MLGRMAGDAPDILSCPTVFEHGRGSARKQPLNVESGHAETGSYPKSVMADNPFRSNELRLDGGTAVLPGRAIWRYLEPSARSETGGARTSTNCHGSVPTLSPHPAVEFRKTLLRKKTKRRRRRLAELPT